MKSLLSRPEEKIIANIKTVSGQTKANVVAWIRRDQVPDAAARDISQACHSLGFDEDVELMREVLKV